MELTKKQMKLGKKNKWDWNVIQEFLLHIRKSKNGCWEYVVLRKTKGRGALFEPGSRYARFKDMPAHRFSWIIHNGAIPSFRVICHKCDNRICVNPDHLFIGTERDNFRDCVRKGRYALYNTRKLPKLSCRVSELLTY